MSTIQSTPVSTDLIREENGNRLGRPFVFALCHQKGGVAKTTTALALGACLAEQRSETILLDLDPQANLTAGLGLNPTRMTASAADVLLGNTTLLGASQETGVPNLRLVPSNADMLTVSRSMYLRPNYEYLLRNSLVDHGLTAANIVVIDCPPTLGPLTLNALTAADLAITPTPCEYFSLQGLDPIMKLINVVRVKTNRHLNFRLLITMFDRRGLLHTRVLYQMRRHFALSLLETMIGIDSKLRESQLEGKPITVYAPSSRAAQQYRQLTQELLAYVRRQILPSA